MYSLARILRHARMKPTYFDMTVRDVARARVFFETLFGWRFERFPMPYEYYRIQAGAENEPGIDGGMGALKDAPIAGGIATTQLTVPVMDVDETLAKVAANGGQVIEPRRSIPGVGWYATCAEPGGLRFGIIQADPNA